MGDKYLFLNIFSHNTIKFNMKNYFCLSVMYSLYIKFIMAACLSQNNKHKPQTSKKTRSD